MRERLENLICEMLEGRILLPEALAEFEKIYIEKAVERNGEHLTKTARVLGIHRNTLTKRLNGYAQIKKTSHRHLTKRIKQGGK